MGARFDLDQQFAMLYTAVQPRAAVRFGEDAVNTAALQVWKRLNKLPTSAARALFADDGVGAVRYFWRAVFHAYLELGKREAAQPASESMLMRDDADHEVLDRMQADASVDVAVTSLTLWDLHGAYRRASEGVRRGMLLRLAATTRSLKVMELQESATIRALANDSEFEVASAWYFGERNLQWFVPTPSSRRTDGTWASTGKIAGMLVKADDVILDTLALAPRVPTRRARVYR